MALTQEQLTLIDAWLPELDVPEPDAGHEAWHTGTVVASLVRQLYDRLKRHSPITSSSS